MVSTGEAIISAPPERPDVEREIVRTAVTQLRMIVVGEMGFSAYFKDPEGNMMGLWQNA